ncbi:MAG TPA: class C sortase [Ruminococcaceae bacterium]|jgi:sortase A|nr:class C sortase [Oscillospiraceae bacterium]HCA71941.1 class C sortase [Oscillospiraceae bacterium]HCM24701.1 class C sortase [Oscillospiraceae bacterium]
MKKTKKKNYLSTILLIVIFLVGLSVLLYPTISNFINQKHATRAVEDYKYKVSTLTTKDIKKEWQAANDYNHKLAESPLKFQNGEPKDATYKSLLNLTGNGMMGYITIQKIGVQLPIYHGTSAEILAAGTGHLEGSSLPVGGKSTHAIITGHRGLPSAKLFTDLDQLKAGDTFTLSILNQTLTYQVDQISIVLPAEVSNLAITPGKDYVTLLTCTPYAINTHRLLVRGFRIPNAAADLKVTEDAVQIDPIIVAPVVAAPILLAMLAVLLSSTIRRKHK